MTAPDGSNRTRVAMPAQVRDPQAPRWSPDGTHLLFVHGRRVGPEPRIGVIRLDGAGFRRLAAAVAADWAADGTIFAAEGSSLRRVFLDGRPPVVLGTIEAQNLRAPITDVSTSPDGTSVALSVSYPHSQGMAQPDVIKILNADGSARRQSGSGSFSGAPGWSPDSRHLVVEGLAIKDLSGRTVRRLPNGVSPSWASPTGARPCGSGYWLVAADGQPVPLGAARFCGSLWRQNLHQPIVGAALR